MSIRRMILAGSAAVVALAACGGGDDSGGTSSRCETPSTVLVSAISEGLNIEGGGSIRRAAAVKSTDFEKVWFVSADLEGAGLEGSDDIATWATNSLDGAGLIYSVSGVAKEFSDWGPGPKDGFSLSDDGVEESQDCVKG